MNTERISSEQILSLTENYKAASVGNWFNTVFKAMTQCLIARDEIIVRLEKTRDGERVWYVYDPLTSKSEYFISEVDALRWIDGQSRNSKTISSPCELEMP